MFPTGPNWYWSNPPPRHPRPRTPDMFFRPIRLNFTYCDPVLVPGRPRFRFDVPVPAPRPLDLTSSRRVPLLPTPSCVAVNQWPPPPVPNLIQPTVSTASVSTPVAATNGLEIWAKVDCEDGKCYYYNVKTKATSWNPPSVGVGPSVHIVKHEDWAAFESYTNHQDQKPLPTEDQKSGRQTKTKPFVEEMKESKHSPRPAPKPGTSRRNLMDMNPQQQSTSTSTIAAQLQHPNRDTVSLTAAGSPIQAQPMLRLVSLENLISPFPVSNTEGNVPSSSVEPEQKRAKMTERKPHTHTQFGPERGLMSSTPVRGTPWCVVRKDDGQVFYYNSLKHSSVWERPGELMGRIDVDEIVRKKPETSTESKAAGQEQAKKKSTITIGKISKINETMMKTVKSCADSTTSDQPNMTSASAEKEAQNPLKPRDSNSSVPEGPLPESSKDCAPSLTEPAVSVEKDQQTEIDHQKKVEEATRLRASIPLETRQAQFKQLLIDKKVSSTSTWEKELHKIIYDSRYLLLTSKERREMFDEYVKSELRSQLEQKTRKKSQDIEKFRKFLRRVVKSSKMGYGEFVREHASSSQFDLIRSSSFRIELFMENQRKLRVIEAKAATAALVKKENQRQSYEELLREKVTDCDASWDEVKLLIQNDRRYQEMEPYEREDSFKFFCRCLRATQQKKLERKRKWGPKPEPPLIELHDAENSESSENESTSVMMPRKTEPGDSVELTSQKSESGSQD